MTKETTPKRKQKNRFFRLWERFIYGWSWYDFVVGAILFWVIGYLTGRANFYGLTQVESVMFNNTILLFLLKLWAVFMFTGRGWQIARYPRDETVKLVDLKGNFMAVLHLNFVSWFHFAIAIIFAYSLAPEIGQIAKMFE